MGKRKTTRSGKMQLRIPPELHEDLAQTAAELGMDMAELVRMMIRRSLPHYRFEARLLAVEASEKADDLERWRRNNPGRPAREFLDDYVRHQRGQWINDQLRFWDDVRFTLNEAYAATMVDDPSHLPADTSSGEPRKGVTS